MNIKQFYKLAKVENKEVLHIALIWLLENNFDNLQKDFDELGLGEAPNLEDHEYRNLSPELQVEFKRLILDLADISEETFNLLKEFMRSKGLENLEDFNEWVELHEWEYVDFDTFKPFSKSYLFESYLQVDKTTGEIQLQMDDHETIFNARLMDVLMWIITCELVY